MTKTEKLALQEWAILVQIHFPVDQAAQETLEEFRQLALAAGAAPQAVITGARRVPDPKYFIGAGKVVEVQTALAAHAATLVLVNHTLSPAQQRNLEKAWQCRVVDRIDLILDIFAQRARTFEGKLQVELAQLQHLSTRLVRGWIHLKRQRGGIGLRGPGETQLETDRRLIRQRIKHIKARLEAVRKQRMLGRQARQRSEVPVVALVGYTNAGKSTLFNYLTGAKVYVANQLFATLDPTLRRMSLPNGVAIILADTVGFIRALPHDLVEAFRATLEETRTADLLLHVVDASNPYKRAHIERVNEVLKEVGAQEVPQILIYNKIDRVPDAKPALELAEPERGGHRVWLSAATGEGVPLLLQALQNVVHQERRLYQVRLSPTHTQLRAHLYDLKVVQKEIVDLNGTYILDLLLSPRERGCCLLELEQEGQNITELPFFSEPKGQIDI